MIKIFLQTLVFLSAGVTLLPAQSGWPDLLFTPVAQGILQPTHIANAGDGSSRLFFVEQQGTIQVRHVGGAMSTFLNITGRVQFSGEQGLLSVVFSPDYTSTNDFYVNYTRKTDGATVISRFHVPVATPDAADAASEEVILVIAQPYTNHNGGQLAFGPDGFLYIGMGDGGSGGDPQNRAQDPSSLLGKMLRIDVEGGTAPYGVPSDNPFVGNSAYRSEIWALGLRNPFRFSFDRLNGDLYIGDVGQNTWEEIDYHPVGSPGGMNYGWRVQEGKHDFNVPSGFDFTSLTPPILEYGHAVGQSVTGGFVVRTSMPSRMNGLYFYGDFITGRIWALIQSAGNVYSKELADTDYGISSFGEDEAGQLYVADYFTGKIYRIQDIVPYRITLGVGAVKGGTVTGAGAFKSGSVRKVVATAKAGYVFKQWVEKGTVVSRNRIYQFTLNRNRGLIAQFVKK